MDTGEILLRLAKQELLIVDRYPVKIPFNFFNETILVGRSELCPFGPLHKEIRSCTETSQKTAAEFAKYNLRNIPKLKQADESQE